MCEKTAQLCSLSHSCSASKCGINSSRNPVRHNLWIPHQVRNDKTKGWCIMKFFNCSKIRLVLLVFAAAILLGGVSAKADFTFGELVNLKSVIPFIDPVYESMNCLTEDGLEMFIGSERPGGQGGWDLWVLKRSSVNEDWGPPENMGSVVNGPSNDAMPTVFSDGLTLCFNSNRADGHGSLDIYITTRPSKVEPWGSPINLGPQVNSSVNDADPWISANGLELYFISKRPGGFGANDIWVTKRATQNEPWSNPENLGSGVNSSYHDMSPCLSPDGLLLLFSGYHTGQGRPGGFGGSDIWMTRRTTTSDSWQEPINLGPKVNSAAHEIIPRISPDGSMLYFTTFVDGIWDNWHVPIVPICDFNGDGNIDTDDLLIMIENWGTSESLCDIGPMPWGDGVVDIEDLKVFIKYWEQENMPQETDDGE
jgi:hypothetical protein